jgi:hypothetical protein
MKGHKKQRCEKKKTIHFDDGSRYDGSIYENLPSGHGVYISDELTYTGQWLAGKKHGEGEEICTSGRSYVGGWRNGLFHGKGILKTAHGSVYDGTFHTGTQHGFGTITTADGSYVGQWNHGTYHGNGTQTSKEGVFKGQFYYNIRHGEGTFTDSHGNIYSGRWRKGMKDGGGVYTTKDGTYSGNWCHNLQHGFGRWVSKYHGIYVGEWKRGKRHRRGTQTYKNGTTYDGGWCKGKRTGHGILTWPDGSSYEGFWLKDEYNGRGTLTFENKSYTGEWQKGKREGNFVEILEDGTTSKGPWLNDVRHGTFQHGNERRLYIWNSHVVFKNEKNANKTASNMLMSSDSEGARVILEYFPTLIESKIFLKCDTDGHLIHLLPKSHIVSLLKQQSWKLFKMQRYIFLERLMELCPEDDKLLVMDQVSELYDALSKDFVPNPWIVRTQSYSEDTKKKLLEGIHLGDFGRCPPKDPYTRLPMRSDSGIYLQTQPRLAKKIYSRFMKSIGRRPKIREMARSFDIQDFEECLKNAREANDRETIKKLMKERNEYLRK